MNHSNHTGIIQLSLVVAFIVIAFFINYLLRSRYEPVGQNSGEERILVVDALEAKPSSYQLVFETTGIVSARTEIGIVPQVSGRITFVDPSFYEGGKFIAENLLFLIDPSDHKLETQRLAAEVASAHTALQIAAVESESALNEWNITNPGKPAPDLVARRPQLSEAEAILESSKAALSVAQLDLDRTHFSFPFSGRVVESNIALGQFVQAGQKYGSVYDNTSLEVNASLEGKKLQWLLNSNDVSIQITANYLGQVNHYQGVLLPSVARLDPDTRFADVRFGFRDESIELVPGVFVGIKIYGPTLEGISEIPASAMQQNGNIWIVDDNDRLTPHRPNIVFSDSKSIAIKDLPVGSIVVISRLSGASEGVKVNISNRNAIVGSSKTNATTPAK